MAKGFSGFHKQVVWTFLHHWEIWIVDLWDSLTNAVPGLTSFERQHIYKLSREMCAPLALVAVIGCTHHWLSYCEHWLHYIRVSRKEGF